MASALFGRARKQLGAGAENPGEKPEAMPISPRVRVGCRRCRLLRAVGAAWCPCAKLPLVNDIDGGQLKLPTMKPPPLTCPLWLSLLLQEHTPPLSC